MKICHLEGVIVSDKYQGKGIASEMVRRAVGDSDVLAFHTQSKKMLNLGRKISEEDVSLTMEVADVIHTRNQQGLLDIRRYGGSCLYGDTTRFAESAIEEGDWQKGDARIFAGFIRR